MLVFQTGLATAAGSDVVSQDALLADANDGVKALFHIGWKGCYSGGTTVPADAAVSNMADPDNPLAVRIGTSGGSPLIADDGLDWRNASVSETYLEFPATVAAAIDSFSQQFLVCSYFRLPTEADWAENADTSNTILNFCDSASYLTEEDIVAFRLVMAGGTTPTIICNRQTSIGNNNGNLSIQVPDDAYGAVSQLSYWRDGTNEYFSIQTPSGRVTDSQAAGSDNSETISDLLMKIGILGTWGTHSTQDEETRKFRVYRGFVEIPATSGRDPLTVINADWVRNYPEFAE
ncbi:MAG: hypothetical protein CML68_13405 [Rhodobacteraceae bacterium]|nr:hypothetical protein [Paracoccaceae bacterium]